MSDENETAKVEPIQAYIESFHWIDLLGICFNDLYKNRITHIESKVYLDKLSAELTLSYNYLIERVEQRKYSETLIKTYVDLLQFLALRYKSLSITQTNCDYDKSSITIETAQNYIENLQWFDILRICFNDIHKYRINNCNKCELNKVIEELNLAYNYMINSDCDAKYKDSLLNTYIALLKEISEKIQAFYPQQYKKK